MTVNASQTCSITGSDPVCSGSTGNVYSGPGGMSSYSWGISGNGTIIGSSTGSAVTVTAGAAGTYTVSVTVTNANGCTSSCSKTVTVNANPTCSISGSTTVCANSASNAYSAPGGMSSYAWSLSGNGTIDGAANTQNLSIDAGAAGTYTVSLTLTDANGCTSSCTQMVTVSAAPTASAGGPYYTTDCTGSTPVSISATASGPGTWSGGAGSFASPTSTSTTYTPTAGEAGTSVMLVWTTTGTGGCGNLGDMATVHVGKQEISLEGNGMNIANGDAIPTSADNTDFGWALVAGGTVSRNFTVMNNGLSALTLPGGTPVTIGGANAGDFTVTLQPASPVAAGNLSLFSIEFDPSGPGLRTATVSIANNDCNESPFTFDIQGTGRVPQQITVLGLGTPIVNRASTASVSDDTDFGSVMVGNMVTHTFTVENIANGAPLGLSGAPRVAIADLNATDFSVTAQPASPVNGGGSTTFTVKFQPTATGLRTAIVIIACDDLPENAFVFTVNGVGN
ncbi:MAG: choice-of-anchor D domain-containing protein [Saprospiraceae bacterium]|nr:choice-of-anchor D domain-containing protein [Saprospiraceae bacterium]